MTAAAEKVPPKDAARNVASGASGAEAAPKPAKPSDGPAKAPAAEKGPPDAAKAAPKAAKKPAGPDPSPTAADKAGAAAAGAEKAAPTPPEPEQSPAANKPPAEPTLTGDPSAKDLIRQVRTKRARSLLVRLGLVVLLPTLLSAVYYGVFASPQFESITVFTIHSSERQQSLALVASLLGAVSSSPATHDTLATREYVLSRDMLKRLDNEHKLISHFKSPGIDWLSRLSADATFEEAYEYYGNKVFADHDVQTGSLTLRVRAYSAAKAHQISRAILSYSEEMVNRLTERERADQTSTAQRELELAEARLSAARQSLLKLQQEHSELSPTHSAQAAMTIRTALEGEVAKARAELMQLRSFMNPEAPQVRAVNEKIRSLSAQVAQESHRLVDPKGKDGIAESMGQFEAAAVEKEFAEKAYASAWAAVEMARSDASRQHRYLVTIAEPSHPDEAAYPRRAMAVLTVFLVTLVIMGIGSLMFAAVREHARV